MSTRWRRTAVTAVVTALLSQAQAAWQEPGAARVARPVTAATATTTAATTTGGAVVSRGVTVPAFYTPPAVLPARNGALVRTEPLRLAVQLPGLTGPLPGRATRLLYTTTDSAGHRVAVSGAYVEPTPAWRGPGPRPLAVVAPGTMGQGDQCSASLGLQYGEVAGVSANGSMLSAGYEDLLVYKLLTRGVAVVVTDYVGLGTTDRLHTYVNRVDGGHAVLDAARAALALSGTSLTSTSPVALLGYSQGGGAVAAAAELQPAYAPGLRLRATSAGAPPADLAAVAAGIDGTELTGALGWAVNGFLQSDPTLEPFLDRYLATSGRAALRDLSTMCVGEAIGTYANRRSSAWTTTGQSLAAILAAEPRLEAFVAGQRIGRLRPAGPVRVSTGVNDTLVPHPQARRLAADWCRRGGDVTYAPLAVPALGSPLLNHFTPLLADQDDAVAWVLARLRGTPAVPTCAVLPLQP